MKQIHSFRHISISQSKYPGVASAISKKTDLAVQDTESLPNESSLYEPDVQVLGKPGTLLSINMPPSAPLYIRRGSLVSIYKISEKGLPSVKIRNEMIQPLKRFFLGLYASRYQKLLSTTSFSVLVSSNSKRLIGSSNAEKSFSVIAFDGTRDWAILNKQALQVHTGANLSLKMIRIPYNISKKLSSTLNLPSHSKTGLLKWNSLGYLFASGRGFVGLSGMGSIYNVELKEEEEILINRENLIALSVNGPNDLKNCVVGYVSPVPKYKSESQSLDSVQFTDKNIRKGSKEYYLYLLKFYMSKLRHLASKFKVLSRYFAGDQNFVRIIGPRFLLLQSNVGSHHNLKISDIPLPKATDIKEKFKAYKPIHLNYVTVEPQNGAVFKSTPNFRESLKK